jgi:hypothetical protein
VAILLWLLVATMAVHLWGWKEHRKNRRRCGHSSVVGHVALGTGWGFVSTAVVRRKRSESMLGTVSHGNGTGWRRNSYEW